MGRAIFKHPLHYRPCLRLPHSNSTHRKRFKALINSGTTITLAHTSVYNMVEDCYETNILPAVLHLKTAHGSLMSPLGKATLHLHIADFKSPHTLIICDKLPETNILFSTYLQKRYCLLYCWDSDKQLFIQREGSFFSYTRNFEQQHNITVVKYTLQVPPRHNSVIPLRIKGHNLKDRMGYFIRIATPTRALIQISMTLMEFITSRADKLYMFL